MNDLVMGVLGNAIRKSAKNAAPNEEDYMEGGLLHCGKCRTRKQKVIELNGAKVLVGVMCDCQNAEYEAAKAADERQQRYYATMQRLDWCDIRMNGKREFCHPRVLQYLEHWEEMLEDGAGLLLWGDVGTGKSTSAAYLAEALKKRFVPAIMTNFAQFGDIKTQLPNFNGVDLLVLDDLGAERQSDFMLERVFEIVDSRARSGKPTVYTTNLRLDDLKEPKDLKYKRLYSRVLERALPVRFLGKDHRKENAMQTMERARKIFEE